MTDPALAVNTNHGRHYTIHDQLLPSITNICQMLGGFTDPLIAWGAGLALERIVDDPDGWHDLVIADPAKAIKEAKWWWKDTRSDAADAGTEIHDWLEAWVDNTGIGMGPHTRRLSDDARQFLDPAKDYTVAHKPRGHTEVTVVGDGYAGTGDLFGYLTGLTGKLAYLNDQPVVLDYKTRKRHDVRDKDIAQLAALRHADRWVDADGTVSPRGFEPVGALLVTFTPKGFKVRDLTDQTGPDAFRAFLNLRDLFVWKHPNPPEIKTEEKAA